MLSPVWIQNLTIRKKEVVYTRLRWGKYVEQWNVGGAPTKSRQQRRAHTKNRQRRKQIIGGGGTIAAGLYYWLTGSPTGSQAHLCPNKTATSLHLCNLTKTQSKIMKHIFNYNHTVLVTVLRLDQINESQNTNVHFFTCTTVLIINNNIILQAPTQKHTGTYWLFLYWVLSLGIFCYPTLSVIRIMRSFVFKPRSPPICDVLPVFCFLN